MAERNRTQSFYWTNRFLTVIGIISVIAPFMLIWTLITPTQMFSSLGFLLVFKKIWLPQIPYFLMYLGVAFFCYKKWRFILVLYIPMAYMDVTKALSILPTYTKINLIRFPFYLPSAVGVWFSLIFGSVACIALCVCLFEHIIRIKKL